MDKKFFDIIPPSLKDNSPKISSPEIKPEPEKVKKEAFKEIKAPLKPEKKAGVFNKTLIRTLIVLFLFLAASVAISFLFFSETKIKVWPETKILTLKESITLDLDQKESDPGLWLETRTIPSQIFKDQKSQSQDFPATGEILTEEKAEGIIRVYNTYSTDFQPLLVNTRFVSADGKLFKSVQREVIAGGKYEKGKLIPGETDIKLRAAEPGEDYNIPASTFSIPGFAGTPKYTAFYGKSFSPMTGGFKGKVAQITQDDLDWAEEFLIEKAEKASKDFLNTALPEDFILIEETISQEVIEKNFSMEAGEKAESFNLEVKVESGVLVFKKSDLDSFVKTLINSKIPEDRKFQEESLEINYSAEIKDRESRKIVLNLEIKAKTYPDIDLDEFEKNVLGKSFQEVRLFLKDQPEINKIEIERGLFWRRNVPEDLDKVEIELNLAPTP